VRIDRLFRFEGRVGRAEHWRIAIVATLFETMLNAAVFNPLDGERDPLAIVLGALATSVIVAATLTTAVKRWHDRGRSWKWLLIVFIPVAGAVWAFIELGFLEGTPGPNRYGWPDSGSPFVG